MGKTITNCNPETENCGSKYAVIFYITLHVVLNWILLNSFSAITVDTFITVLEEHDEIVRLEKVWDEFNKQWIEYDMNKSGEVDFVDLINIYDEFELPKGAQWGSHERVKGLLATKPPIEELFKNIKVKNNKCNYNDAIFSFLNCWMGEELPESYVKKEKVVPKTGYEKKAIEKYKEKTNGGSNSSSLTTTAMSTPTATINPYNFNPKELNNNTKFYLSDEDEDEMSSNYNVETPRQFNNRRNLSKIDILIDNSNESSQLSSPLSSVNSSLITNDDERTINFKNTINNEPDSENNISSNKQRKDSNNSSSSANNINSNPKSENSYSSNTSDVSNNSERIPLNMNIMNHKHPHILEGKASTFGGHEEKINNNNSNSLNKKFKLPLKETFSETFSKGKAILLPKGKYSSFSSKDTTVEDQEIPFNVVYNIWKVQHKFKTKKQDEQNYDEINIS